VLEQLGKVDKRESEQTKDVFVAHISSHWRPSLNDPLAEIRKLQKLCPNEGVHVKTVFVFLKGISIPT
jgi:hypothetical protein